MSSRYKKLAITTALVSMSSISSTVFAQTKEGAMLGGVAGAVIGGIVGHQNDETPEGALIGGAVGAIAGGMIGNQRQQQERIRYYEQQQYQQRYYQQPQCYHNHYQVQQTPVYTTPTYVTTVRPAPPVRRAVTAQDVVMLTRNRVSEKVIANQIQMNGVVSSPSIDDVLMMHDAGVSDFVINEMQHARLVGSTTVVTQTQVAPQPVIVREEIYSTPIDHAHTNYYNGSTPYYQRSSQLQPVPVNRQRF